MDNEKLAMREQVLLDIMEDKHYVPMKIKELAILLQVPKEDRQELKKALDRLQAAGKIELSKRGKYRKAEEEIAIGIFIANPRGFGFVEVEGREEDIFIPEDCVGNAFHSDTVQVAINPKKQGKRAEGKIKKVLSHGLTEVIGTYQQSQNFGFVVSDNLKIKKDIFIPIEASKGAINGHKVQVKITDYGSQERKPEGKIEKIIGHINDPGVDILSIIHAYDLPIEFPEKIMNQAEKLAVEVSPADMEGRLDLRDWQIVTIDGEDAKDLDDGISLTKEGAIYHLGVHIADVTNYVQEGSALDREALKRGTSVYLADRVIPMLPHKLSNGICSLNQGVDRLALSCLMDIDEQGNVIGHQIAETVIHVEQRLTYTAVNQLIEEEPFFMLMKELADILREKRHQRGSINFDFPEGKLIIDEMGKPVAVRAYERNAATKIIEDFMLLANETVAEDFFWQEIPFIYRTHENPDLDRIRQLALIIHNFGYTIKNSKEDIHPKELQKLLVKALDSPEEMLINRLTLRSMKQARYGTECTGHFGLAAKYYCHFTSPIRRYPDLQIHRIIKDSLRGRMNGEKISHYQNILSSVAARNSKAERVAEEVEREVNKMKKAEYMQEHIGEIFEGVISGITAWGMYVELENTIEGMIHVSNMYDDRYYYHEEDYEMVGADTGKTYQLGQKLAIKVLAASKQTRTIDFEMIEEGDEESGKSDDKTDCK